MKAVRIEGPGKLLRIFVGESDRYGGKPLYQAIVETLRERGLAGATVLRGIEGFGAHSRIHTFRLLRLSEDLPVVIEVVDSAERIDAIIPVLDEMVEEGLVTVEPVEVIAYRSGGRGVRGGAESEGAKRAGQKASESEREDA